MKSFLKPQSLRYLVLGAGALGLLLRILLYAVGLDEKGLLETGHLSHILIWVLTAVVAAGLILLTRSIQGPNDYRDAFPVSAAGCAGAVLAALGILITTIGDLPQQWDLYTIPYIVMGFVGAAALVFTGLCRLGGYKPSFLCHVALCLYFALRLVSQYRQWSADPQLQDYLFHMLSCISLMFIAYQRAAFDMGNGSHRQLWLFSLAAVYLCCLSIKGQDGLFYFTCAAWAFTGLSSLTARPRRRRPQLNLNEEEPQED